MDHEEVITILRNEPGFEEFADLCASYCGAIARRNHLAGIYDSLETQLKQADYDFQAAETGLLRLAHEIPPADEHLGITEEERKERLRNLAPKVADYLFNRRQ